MVLFFIILLFIVPFLGVFISDLGNDSIKNEVLHPQANESSDSVGDEWRMFGKYLNRSRATTTTPQRNTDRYWRYGVSNWIEHSSPAVADGRVFFTSANKNIYCINETTGQYIWSFWEWPAATYSSPAVANGYVYWQHWNYLYCRNAADGAPVWSTNIGSSWYSPCAVANGRVYIGASTNLTCLDASNGNILWSSETDGLVYGGPAVVNGRAFIGSYDNQVYCFNATSGEKIWNFTTRGDIDSTPAVVNGRVYVGSYDNNVYCLNETNGLKIWNYTTNDDIWNSPAVAYGRVYVGSFDTNVYCLNATDGAKLWNFSIGAQSWSSPAVGNGMVYIGSVNEYLYCLNATSGEELWKYKASGDITSSPAIANGRVYFGTRSSRLYCIPMILDHAPEIDLTSHPNESSISKGEIICFNISDHEDDLNMIWYSLDGGGNIMLPLPYQIDTSAWAVGRHILRVSANDSYGFTATKKYEFIVRPPTAFFDYVENGTNGWTTSGTPTSNDTYGWHIVQADSYSPTHSWWCGDDISGQTGNNWNLSLVSPLLNLTTAYIVNFSFYHKYDIDQDSDYAYVEININGTLTWTPIASFTGTQSSWVQSNYDISSYAGNYIYLRFRFESDSTVSASGWYVDDIAVDVTENFNAPILSDGNVTPPSGNTWIPFTYWVNYTDPDDNSPTEVNVVIDGMPYAMDKDDPSDIYYTDGCLFKYSTKLNNITHDYFFNASDGVFAARNPPSGNYSGPPVDLYFPKGPLLTDWYQTWGGNDQEFGWGVTVDGNNNSYLVGHSESFGAGNMDGFIVKYDPQGTQMWNRTWGGTANDEFYGVAVDTNGGIYAVGETSSFGAGVTDALIVKYNATGNQEWNQTYGTVNFDSAQSVIVNNNNISVVGSTTPLDVDALLLTYNTTGSLLKTLTWGGPGSDRGYDLVMDNENNTIIVGETDSFGGSNYEAFFAKFDSSGNLLKNQTWGGISDATAYGVDVDINNNIYIAGTTPSHLAGSKSAFILKYNASGDLERQHLWTAGNDAYGYDVGTDNEENYFLFGYVRFSGGSDYNASLVKYDKFGNQVWNQTWGNTAYDYEITYDFAMGKYDDFYFGGRNYMGTGNVYDGLLVKLYWPLPPAQPPTLNAITPDPSNDGFILLGWSEVPDASRYYLYRDTQNITSTTGLNPIKELTTNYTQDLILDNDTYYYAVVAGNIAGNSTHSNVQSVVISLIPSLLDWNQTWGGDQSDFCQDIAVDSYGNSYVTGVTYSYGIGTYAAFLLKYNSTGHRLWNQTWGGPVAERANGIALDTNNNIYMTGETLSFDIGGRDAFLVKYDAQGVQLWNTTFGTSNSEYCYAVATDSQNNAYICGTRLISGNWVAYLVKYNTTGTELWNRSWFGSNTEWGYDVAVDDYDNVYLVGYTDSFTVGGYDGFVAKYDPMGNQIWNRTWGGAGNEIWRGITIDSNNNSYITGYSSSFGIGGYDIAMVKYDSMGNQLWNRTWGGYSSDYGYSIVLDENNSCYIVGATLSFTIGYEDVVLLKYNSTGHQQWIRHWGTPRRDVSLGNDLDKNANCYLAGYVGTTGLPDYDTFILRYATGTPLPINYAPILSNGAVTPPTGRPTTEFTFEVNYTDVNNDPPNSIIVYINGSGYTMTKRFADSNYTDGCIYEYKTTLSPGTYTYYFTASDPEYSTRLPAATEFFGPTVTPNQVPQLSDPILSPSAGYNTTPYTFSINYTDGDNDAPFYINLIINGVGAFGMSKQNASDSNYVDGCIYTHSLSLDVGNYTHYFNASDGFDSVTYPTLIGPNVTILPNLAPQLLGGSVIPSSGDASTIFIFKVTYMDPDNDPPNEIYVVLDGFNYSMSKANPADTNYTDGIEYIYATTLSVGPHTYYFTTSDGISADRYPTAGTIDGPTFGGPDGGPPGIDLMFAIIIAVALAVAIPIVTFIMGRKRRPAGPRKPKTRPLELKPVKKLPPAALHVKAEPTEVIQPPVVKPEPVRPVTPSTQPPVVKVEPIKPVTPPTQPLVVKVEPIKPVTPLPPPVQPPAVQAPLTEAQLKEILDSVPYLPASEKEKLLEKLKNMSYELQQSIIRAFKR